MKSVSFRKASITAFLIVICLAYLLFVVERFLTIRNNELEKIRLFGLPSAQTLAHSIEIRLNERLHFFQNIANEIEGYGVHDKGNQTTLDEIQSRNNATITGMGILDRHGTALYYSPLLDPDGQPNIGKTFSDREYFIAAAKGGEATFGHIVIGRGSHRFTIPLLIPLKKGNEIEGYLLAGLDLAIARELTESFETQKMMRVTLVDDRGTVLSKPGMKEFETQMEDLSKSPIFVAAQRQPFGISYYTSLVDGRNKLGAYSRLSNGWVVWISYDLGEMDADILANMWGFVLVSLLFLGISVFLIIIIVNLISKPILSIAHATENITENSGGLDLLDARQKQIVARFKETELLSTSLQEMLDKLNEYHHHLDRMVAEKTSELDEANTQLQIKTQEAESANKAKSDFLASMSHELRTPLNSILGFAELLLMDETIQGPTREYLGYISQSAHHLLDLINDILDLSKIEAGKLEPFFESLDPRQIAEETVLLFKEKAMTHRINFSVRIEENIPQIWGDKRMLKQILFNLLGNSFKFTADEGKIGVYARKYSVDGKEYVQFEVRDSGVGIAKDEQKKLFQPFVTLDTNIMNKQKGTGLGLALCRKLVELHLGSIWLESEEGVGTSVFFIIPVVKEV